MLVCEMDLTQLRLRAKLNIEDVAYVIGVSRQTIYNWESGRTVPTFTPKSLKKLLALYQCSLDELITAIDESTGR